MNPPPSTLPETGLRQFRDHVLRLLTADNFPELESWRGCLRLGGLWLVLLIGCTLAPFYALLRLPFRRGGWRFLVGLFAVFILVAFGGILILLSAGLGGMGAAR